MQTNYTPSKSSRSSSIEQDETTIEIPHMKNEVVSNRKTQTPDRGVAAGGARAPAEIGRSVNSIQTRGADYAPHITAIPHPPESKSYLHLCTREIRIDLLNCLYPGYWQLHVVICRVGGGKKQL